MTDKKIDNLETYKMFTVKVKKIACTPRKMGLVANMIQKLSLVDASETMRMTQKKASLVVAKALQSLIAQIEDYISIKKAKNLDSDQYAIKRAIVGKSIMLKRRYYRAKGRADTRTLQYSMLYIEAIPHQFLNRKRG